MPKEAALWGKCKVRTWAKGTVILVTKSTDSKCILRHRNRDLESQESVQEFKVLFAHSHLLTILQLIKILRLGSTPVVLSSMVSVSVANNNHNNDDSEATKWVYYITYIHKINFNKFLAF